MKGHKDWTVLLCPPIFFCGREKVLELIHLLKNFSCLAKYITTIVSGKLFRGLNDKMRLSVNREKVSTKDGLLFLD